MKGYKVIPPDWKCKDILYEVGKTYEMDGTPICCERGFHFCEKAIDCFDFYKFDSQNHVVEVEALGDVDTDAQGNSKKHCTNKIHLIRELDWHEVLDLVNAGKNCTGIGNSGNRNSGNRNSGGWNSGSRNSGDCNSGSNNSGCFNTEDRPLFFFDKPTDITMAEWRNSEAYKLMRRIEFNPTRWITFNEMSEEEKQRHPEAKTTGGYLKTCDNSKCFNEWWDKLTDDEKEAIKEIPNFDAEKFYKITGIRAE